VASSASTTLGGGSAPGSLARFELSAQARRRSEDLAPAASTTSECSAMLAHPSTELVDKTRKRDVQTGGVAGAPELGFTLALFSSGEASPNSS